MQTFGTLVSNILGSQLMMHFVYATTDRPALHLFQVYATTQIEIVANQNMQTGVIWNKNYLFEGPDQGQKELDSAITKGIELLVNQYFSSHEKGESKTNLLLLF